MEFILVSAIAGMGYLLSKNNVPRQTKITYTDPVSKNYKPSGNNIYDNTRTQTVWKEQQELADRIFAKSKNSLKTNYMIAGPPVPIFNKVDGTDQTLPIEFIGANGLKQKVKEIEKELAPRKYEPQFNRKVNDLDIPTLYKDFAAAGGWNGISLTGNPVDRESFFHNNMVPFFGGTVKQNIEENSNQTLLESFTGNDPNYQQKVEVKRDDLFKPVANLSNPYGMSNLDGYNLDRYVVSNLRNNQAPIEPIRVGPGLNQGYTAEGSGGFQQANTLDFVLPKTVDELRVKTNPKVSYEGVVVPGSHIAKPGKVGIVAKNKPDTFYVNGPDRLFTSVGDVTGPTLRPDILIKYTNRKTTELKNRVGPATAAAIGSQPQMKPVFKQSTRINFAGANPRNQNAVGQWVINGPNRSIPNDYGRGSMKTKPNNRQVTGPKMQVTNLSVPNKNAMAPNQPNVRHTRKTNIVGNNRYGNFQNTGPNRGKVYDPNDLPRTTIKEQNVHNSYQGNFQNTGPNRGQVYDPNDLPRTTIKEQNIDNNHQGYFQNTGPNRGQVYDPNDLPRTTIKEQNIDNSYQGNFQNTGPNRGQVYDPNDLPRTTIKEQNIDNNYQGNFQNTGPNRGKVYDPNDLPRTTIKEQSIDNNYQGNFQNTGPNRGQVYDPNDLPKTTIKEQNIDNSYQGNFQNTGPNRGKVYDPNNLPRTTIKEQNIDNSYQGNFQNTGPNRGKVYDPNNLPRTTIKEQMIDNSYQGNFQNTGPNRGKVYDPNDLPRTTVKEQTIDGNRLGGMTGRTKGIVYDPLNTPAPTIKQQTMVKNSMGNIQNQLSGGAYKTKKMDAKNTQRMTTSVHYTGDATGPKRGGYTETSVKAKNTVRQFLTGEVKGNAAPASVKAPKSYGDVYNATIHSVREQVAVGRTPSKEGAKVGVSKEAVNMNTSRHGDQENVRIENRGVMSTKIYNSIPQPNQFGETHFKDTLPNDPIGVERINPDILDAFRKNPYSQSLHSYAWQ
jgi:hypothetical protein